MNRLNLNKLLPFFFLGTFIFLYAGLGTAYIQTQWNLQSLLGVCLGLCCLVFCGSTIFHSLRKRILLTMTYKYFLKSLFLISLGLLIIGLNVLAFRFDIRMDLTQSKQHTLSQKTQNILKELNDDVDLIVFHVGIVPYYVEDLLKEIQRHAPEHITTRIVDPLVDIGYAAQFGTVIKGDERKVIVQSEKERQDIDYQNKPLSEEAILNAIIKVTREERRVCFLTGHSEYDTDDDSAIGLSTFKTLLGQINSTVKELTLGIDTSVPKTCDVLVIPGPKAPFPREDIDIVQEYLEEGGRALFLIESTPVGSEEKPLREEDKKKNPALNEILNRWGLTVNNDIVVDMENFVGGDVGCPATKNYPPHEQIVGNLDYTFYIRPRSITFNKDRAQGLKLAPLVLTASKTKSWAERSQTLEVKFDEEEDLLGPVKIGAVVWDPPTENKKTDTKIIVITDSDFITNTFIGQFSNALFALNAVSWLTDLDNISLDQTKELQPSQLDLTSKQIRSIIVVLFLGPLSIALLGIIVLWKNRDGE